MTSLASARACSTTAHPRLRGEDRIWEVWGYGQTGSPRLRGEDGPRCSSNAVSTGSPPPVRGRLTERAAEFGDRRLTPAWGYHEMRLVR